MSQNNSEKSGDEILLGILGLVALVMAMIFKETVGRTLYLLERWSDSDHPRYHWLALLFGIPLVLVIASLFTMFVEPATGFLGLFMTAFGFWIAVSIAAFFSGTKVKVKPPALPTPLDNLDTYLEPFAEPSTPTQAVTQPVAVASGRSLLGLYHELMRRVLTSNGLIDDPELKRSLDSLAAKVDAQSADPNAAHHPVLDWLLGIGRRSWDIERLAAKPGMEGKDALVAYLRNESPDEDSLTALRALLRK
jgi:hypothetical protein